MGSNLTASAVYSCFSQNLTISELGGSNTDADQMRVLPLFVSCEGLTLETSNVETSHESVSSI